MKIMDEELKPLCAYHKIDTFCGEWDTKEGPGKPMKNALYMQRYGKRHLSGWSNVKQRKNQACNLAIFKLRKSEGFRQTGSYLFIYVVS